MASKNPTPPRSLGRALSFAASATSTLCNRLLDPHGLSLAQWAVLSVIWRNGALGVTDISRLTGNKGPATTRIIDRMISADLLVRSADPDDRRAVIVDLSDKGEALRPLETFFETINEILTEGMTAEEAEQAFRLLNIMEANARAAADTGR